MWNHGCSLIILVFVVVVVVDFTKSRRESLLQLKIVKRKTHKEVKET